MSQPNISNNFVPSGIFSGMNHEMNDAMNLFRILSYDRKELLDFLVLHGNCENLSQKLEEIELNNPENKKIVYDLLLGLTGLEINKCQAIYELPTHEIVKCVSIICEELGILKVEEIAAGVGLLAGMLQKMTNLEVNATDGELSSETSKHLYFDVTQKMFLEYAMDEENYDDRLVILAWQPPTKDINEFVQKKNPKQMLVISETYDTTHSFFDQMMLEAGYKRLFFPVRQICFRDYFKNNTQYPNGFTKSCCILYIKSDDERVTYDQVAPRLSDEIVERVTNLTPKMIVQDMIVRGELPDWMLEVLSFSTAEFTGFLAKLDTCKIPELPEYIETYEEFDFWYQIKFGGVSRFPKIVNREKFLEYRTILTILNEENGLDRLKQYGIVDDWILNGSEALKYLYLDFSCDTKEWKESKTTFERKYNQTLLSRGGRPSLFGSSLFGI